MSGERVRNVLKSLQPAARRQYGVVTRGQLNEAGVDCRWITRQVKSGALQALERDVFLLAGWPGGFETVAMAACLQRGPAAWIGCLTAARVWGLAVSRSSGERIDVVVPWRVHCLSTTAVAVHRARRLDSADVALRVRLPITTVARTIIDLAGELVLSELVTLVDDALVRGQTTLSLLRNCRTRTAGSGVRGSGNLTRAIEPWLEGLGGVESHGEAEVLRWLLAQGFEQPVCQFVVVGRDGFVARVDFCWPRCKLVLEVDGYLHHHGPSKLSLDHERKSAVAAEGYRVLTTTVAEVRRGGPRLRAALLACLDTRT